MSISNYWNRCREHRKRAVREELKHMYSLEVTLTFHDGASQVNEYHFNARHDGDAILESADLVASLGEKGDLENVCLMQYAIRNPKGKLFKVVR